MGQLEDLRAFVQIVENESIGKAADQAGIAKSAMSRKLRLLEDKLQTELIVRTTRQWALTAAGKNYFAHAQKIIAAMDEADAEISNEEVEASGEIRLSVRGRSFPAVVRISSSRFENHQTCRGWTIRPRLIGRCKVQRSSPPRVLSVAFESAYVWDSAWTNCAEITFRHRLRLS